MFVRLLLLILLAANSQWTAAIAQIKHVNPFIGTGGHGHTYPGATAPFGLVQLSPDTRIDMMDWDGCSGYHYSDSIIYGFSHTHLSGTGVADYCDILFMPFTGGAQLEPAEYASKFKKSKEKAEAGYYSVFLEKDKILAELTATERVGVHRYTFPGNRERGHILIDLRHRDEVLDSYMKRVSDREIEGYRISNAWAKEQHVYFVARFSRPFFASKILDMSKNPRESTPALTGKAIVGLLDFYNDSEPLVVTVGISGVSIEGARKNLETECAHFDFEKIKTETQAKWQRQLSKIEVEGGTNEQKTIFYTALYHTMLAPNIWNDADGQYRGRDNKIHQASPNPSKGGETHDVYTVFSLWDTYRALHPLHTILEPKRTNDFIQTFLRQYEQGGLLPVWELAANETDCMIGNHAIPVIYDAVTKKLVDEKDYPKLLEAMLKSANSDRYGLKHYRERGYVPADKEPESVSKTLEYAYDDWCIARMASLVGEKKTSEEFYLRAQSYKNLFDPTSRFFRAKSNATWYEPFDPYEVNFNYTEANAWQYLFAVQQDFRGLVDLFAQSPTLLARQLDSLFAASTKTTGRNQADITGLIGQYVHGNEPSHHVAYLYSFVKEPWKTQQLVRQILDEMYANRPDGLIGNEDCGQMSAWLVFSAMGFYPAVPGQGEYVLGAPWFQKITIRADGKPPVVLQFPPNLEPGVLIKRAKHETKIGTSYTSLSTYITHEELIAGGLLEFETVNIPTAEELFSRDPMWNFPNSVITTPLALPMPFVAKGERGYKGEQMVELGCLAPNATIYYTLDSDKAKSKQSTVYTQPIPVKGSGMIVFYAGRGERHTKLDTFFFTEIRSDISLHRYNTRYSPQYTARGDNGLIDGIRGGADFRTGDWQGFEGTNLDVVLDLSKIQQINKVSVGFMQDENAWVFFPTKMRVEISGDGQNFSPVGEVVCEVPPTEKGVLQKDFVLELKGKKARYVRVVGVSLGKCPEWHKGAGYASWVFSDEIVVE
ncbi:MAG: GH92 family glycosyl hydrolase [Saprospiraceae bacterium]|nr:GH92 family glycosyl hydrolase [Saprospiraceae bacterium]